MGCGISIEEIRQQKTVKQTEMQARTNLQNEERVNFFTIESAFESIFTKTIPTNSITEEEQTEHSSRPSSASSKHTTRLM